MLSPRGSSGEATPSTPRPKRPGPRNGNTESHCCYSKKMLTQVYLHQMKLNKSMENTICGVCNMLQCSILSIAAETPHTYSTLLYSYRLETLHWERYLYVDFGRSYPRAFPVAKRARIVPFSSDRFRLCATPWLSLKHLRPKT